MIRTVMLISMRRLLHNRVELLLTFIVPVVFFSVFALIFGKGVGSGTTPKIKVVAVDEANTPASQRVIETLHENEGLRFMRDQEETLARQDASEIVRRGSATMAIVLVARNDELGADLLTDASDQVASQVVSGLVSRSLISMQAQHRHVPGQHIAQRLPVEESIQVLDIMGEGKANPVVSMYAAGIAVMFLLFGATGGGGALLEERENRTLDRLLSSGLSMDQLLLGKWFYMTALGSLQVGVMFLWAQLVFGVNLLGHLDGFVMMTVVTASAASAFGLLLATLCKTRGQLNGLSVILVLTMSALGGSMVPRYVMSQQMQEYGLWTFNAWALDGYDKVFWRELPVSSLAPQLAVLMFSGFGFLLFARVLATRWETN